jgi:2-dehydro-3-deoxygalactonokinase
MSGLKKANYAKVLDKSMVKLGIPANTPVVICGMAGAAQGWCEAPYMSTSEDVFSLGGYAVRAPELSREVHILPGIMQSVPSNVMRGEETQILGLLATQPDFEGTVCMPGTHTKWVRIHNGCIDSFTTCMTGELFALLSEQSVLKHSMASSGWDDVAFELALLEVMASPMKLAESLFGLRAATLWDNRSPETARARLSGMLIGLELAAIRTFWESGKVTLIGEPSLCQTYFNALTLQHAQSHILDA